MTQPNDSIDRQIMSCLQSNGRFVNPVAGGFEYQVATQLGRVTIHVCHTNGSIALMAGIKLPRLHPVAWKCVVQKCIARSGKGGGQFHFKESPFRVAYTVSERIDASQLCAQIHRLFRRATDTLIASIKPCLRPPAACSTSTRRHPPHPDSGLT